MDNTAFLSNQPSQSCVASFQVFYGIGKVKATKLNSFLLNHPVQTTFNVDFTDIAYSQGGFDLWTKIPKDLKIRLCVENHLRMKSLIYCYQMFRLFQNLPTRGQRTRANAKSHSNQNPYLSLRINLSLYRKLQVAYKKRELLYNDRFDELTAYIKAQEHQEQMVKEDRKTKNKKTKQNIIKRQKNKK
jgi:ribosomal protein S13